MKSKNESNSLREHRKWTHSSWQRPQIKQSHAVITELRLSNVLWVLRKPQTKALKSSDSAKGPTWEHSEGEVPLTSSHGRLQSSCKDLCLGCTGPFKPLTSLPAEHASAFAIKSSSLPSAPGMCFQLQARIVCPQLANLADSTLSFCFR